MERNIPTEFDLSDLKWFGPRLNFMIRAVPGSLQALLMGHELPTDYYAKLIESAAEDGKEFKEKQQYKQVSQCSAFAVVAAQKMGIMKDLKVFQELVITYVDSLLLLEDWPAAICAAFECVTMDESNPVPPLQWSVALQGKGEPLAAANVLLKAMMTCTMTQTQQEVYIARASNLIGNLKYLAVRGGGHPKDIFLNHPPLPESGKIWSGVMAKLSGDKDIVAMAFLTVGFGNHLPSVSCLDSKCPSSVDLSSCHVEDVYEALSAEDLQMWGEKLAIFIAAHGGLMGKRTSDPLAVSLVRLSLEHDTMQLLRHVLKTRPGEFLTCDEADKYGDSALHIVAKWRSFNSLQRELMLLLLNHGARPNVRDRFGEIPLNYITNMPSRSLIDRYKRCLKHPEEGFKQRIALIKKEGNDAHSRKDSKKALHFYQLGIQTVVASGYRLPRQLAVFYNNAATVLASIKDSKKALQMATDSIKADPTFHKPYRRAGKLHQEKKEWKKASDMFIGGLGCEEADEEQKELFIQDFSTLLPSMPETEARMLMPAIMPALSSRWAKIVELLCKNSQWDSLRCLVLGPPTQELDKASLPPGWKFADCYKEGRQHKVGYAMCLKATTPDLHTVVEAFDSEELNSSTVLCLTDLLLALILQGAKLNTLLTDDEETCYHTATYLCCSTERLGLLRFILSEDYHLTKARQALNRECRTILHSSCLLLNDGTSAFGAQMVRLLLDKGFDPQLVDKMGKKAVDYVAPATPLCRLLRDHHPDSGRKTKTSEELKDLGNAEFKRKNYRRATELYSQAISVLQQKLPSNILTVKGHMSKKHELAVLFSNRAECHLKLGSGDLALSDAMESVSFDGHWYRGHVRVGRALLLKKNVKGAIKAFSNAFSALELGAPETQRKEVLKELVTAMSQTDAETSKDPGLGYVSADLWAKVAYDLFCAGRAFAELHAGERQRNTEWEAGSFAYRLFEKAPSLSLHNLPMIQLDLKPLCSWQMGEKIVEQVVELIHFLVVCGSDPSTLSFYDGDTYIHAAAIFTTMSGNTKLLDLLMVKQGQLLGEQSLQDMYGNTALHIFAMPAPQCIPPPPYNIEIRHDLCSILLGWGVNPLVKNKQGVMAVQCVPKGDKKVYRLLEKATKEALEKCPAPPPPPQRAATTKAGPKDESAGSKTSAGSKVGGEEADEMEGRQRQCDQCEKLLSVARDLFGKGQQTHQAYSRVVSLLDYRHAKDTRHTAFVRKGLDLMVEQLEKSLAPEIPDVFLKISETNLRLVLEKLASHGRWRQLEAVVTKAKANDVPQGPFGRNMSILALLEDKGLCSAESQRLQILDLLLSHEACLKAGQMKQCVQAAVDHGEFQVVQRLLEHGASPRLLSLHKGDTPLHAALAVALHKDKGNNFSLLDHLLSLYQKDPGKLPYLAPSSVDNAGDTLLHAACRAHYTKHSHRAVELLMEHVVPVEARNNEGRLAADYLKPHDRRTQYLRMALAARKTDPPKDRAAQRPPSSQAPPPSQGHRPMSDGGDNEQSAAPRPQRKEKVQAERPTLTAKQSLQVLTGLVEELSELTSAEVKLAKSGRDKWLEADKGSPHARSAGSVREEGEEDGAGAKWGEEQDAEADSGNDSEEEEAANVDLSEADLDLTFDNLEWEVDCTADVWKILRDKHILLSHKQRIVRCIRFLASGEWRPQLCQRVHGAPENVKLYMAKFVKGARILWELAITFSPRLSEDAERRMSEDEGKGDFAVQGGRMYTESIRIWDIVFHYDKLKPAIRRVLQSHERGQQSLIHKELRGVKSQQFSGMGLSKRLPMLYSEADLSEDVRREVQSQEDRLRLCPPASSSDMEFHILKFYCFSSALVYNILKNLDMKIDFPFRVTDREHSVINLVSLTPILLLGRSGTGKTTCCLYRLWSRFLIYWTKSKEMDYAPWIPRSVPYDESASDEEAAGGDDDSQGATAAPSDQPPTADKAPPAREPSPSGADGVDGDGEEEEERGEVGEEEEEQEAPDMAGVHYDHLHQLFVTKNQVLCSEVQKNFRELCHADEVAHFHVEAEEAPMPCRLQDMADFKFPLFVTSRQLLLLLDASLPPPYFFPRNDDGSLRVTIHGWGNDEEIFAFVPLDDDSDEEGDWSCDDGEEDGAYGGREDGDKVEHRPKKKDSRREATYEVFAHEIWPKIKKKVTYHPSLVWTEIFSFIKGSFAALLQPKGYLDKESYERLGRKQAPNFTGSRDKVYELFLRYLDYNRQHGLYDEADLVFQIFQRLKLAGPLPWVLHEVFVDETQDFTQAELTVLIRLAHNPNDMFLTGDTAQSIMRGVAFRFSDLKTLFHYAKESLRNRGNEAALEVPRQVYQLTHNYRSHAGILSMASAVLDLLVEFFPESFDRLQKDQGLFDGPKPVILESGKPADLAILLSSNKRKTSHIEFGAHQVILVATEEAKKNLPEELSMALVLTIYQAKGLEFDDVLLYNFFTDSQASREWRVVTDFLERLSRGETGEKVNTTGLVEIDEGVLKQTDRPRPLDFDPNCHKILSSELKHLYTAVTRARTNVWIFDQDAAKRAPMFEYFKARKLVEVVSNEDIQWRGGSSMFAEKSSPEEWEQRGDEMMRQHLYSVAAKCYSMAEMGPKERIALAYQRALEAMQLRAHPHLMRPAFLDAAAQFLECHADTQPRASTLALRFNLVSKAARCLQNARENFLAAQVFEKNGELEVAGPVYLRARKWIEASQCFERQNNFGRAVKILDEQERYDEAIDCLQRYMIHRQGVGEEGEGRGLQKPDEAYTVASLSHKAATLYHRLKDRHRMLAAIERLPKREEQVLFLQTHGYVADAASLLCQHGHTTEASTLMLYSGEVDKAIAIAEKGTDNAMKAQCYWVKAFHLRHTTPQDSKEDQACYNELDQVVELAERAQQKYDVVRDWSGVGQCQLLQAEVQANRDLLSAAFTSFRTTQPVPNIAGTLECVQVLFETAQNSVDYLTCRKLIWGLEKVFEVVHVLLEHTTADDRNKYQMYLNFYGVERSGADKVLIYPKLKPRCVLMMDPKYFSLTKEDGKEVKVVRPVSEVCSIIAQFLISRSKMWRQEVEAHLQDSLPKVKQCASYMEGVDCEDSDMCPYQHDPYTQALTESALQTFSCHVRLDHALQRGASDLARLQLDPELCQVTASFTQQEDRWFWVERMLDFVFPQGLLTYHMPSVLDFCQHRQQHPGVWEQVKKYVLHQWDHQGRVGKGKSDNIMKERCKSTDWFVTATVLNALFKLDIQINKECTDLEILLSEKKPSWTIKRKKYALLKEGDTVILMARRHLMACHFLQPNTFDPFEAVIKFTKFVTLLYDRAEVGLMPKLPVFLFWMETFATLALCLGAKLRGKGVLFVPSCYLGCLDMLGVMVGAEDKGGLMRLLHAFRLKPSQTARLLARRIESITFMLCGGKSAFSLLSHLVQLKEKELARKKESSTYLLMERCLLLALTLYINGASSSVPTRQEHIHRCIQKIPCRKMPDMPPRLWTLIDGAGSTASCQQVTDVVQDCLADMDETAAFYRWGWSSQEPTALTPVDPSIMEGQTAQAGAATAEEMDEIDEDIGETVEEGEEDVVVDEEGEEEEISPEEKMLLEQQIADSSAEEKKIKAANTLRKFFRFVVLKKRCPKTRFHCIRQIKVDLFISTKVTDKLCGICGIGFEKSANVQKTGGTEDNAERLPSDQGGEGEEDDAAKLKQAHFQSEQHRKMSTDYYIFLQVYESTLSQPLIEIGAFISKCQVKKQRNNWYKGLGYQVGGVLKKMETVQHQLDLTIQKRLWNQRHNLINLCNELRNFFFEHVRDAVLSIFNRQQEMLTRSAAARKAEKLHQERLNDSAADNPTLDALLEVVQQPQARVDMHVHRGRSTWVNQGRGRGQGHFRGRGRRGRGQLPPRFQPHY